MNSRQRVTATASFSEPDRVPLDLGGHRSSGISAIAYAKLKKELGISSGNIFVYDMIQQLAVVEEEILELFEVDVVELGRAFLRDEKDWKDWELPDGTPCKIPGYVTLQKEGEDHFLLDDEGLRLAVMKKNCMFFEQIHWPLEKEIPGHDGFAGLENQLGQNMWSAVASPGGHLDLREEKDLKHFREAAGKFRASTDRAVIGIFGGNMFELPQMLYRMDNYLLYTAMYPEKVYELSEQLAEIHLANLRRYLAAAGEFIDIILFGDDLGGNTGPLIDPEMYRRYYKPFHTKLWGEVKNLAPHLKIQLHSCGGIEPFLDDLIEAGLDMINPVQVSAAGMDPVGLKEQYGDRICFWGGGCDTREILNHGTPDEVEAHVRKMLSIWKPGGGYVFQQVHNIMSEVPAVNIIRMFETVHKYR